MTSFGDRTGFRDFTKENYDKYVYASPVSYSPKLRSASPTFTFGEKCVINKRDNTPGPGAYSQ